MTDTPTLIAEAMHKLAEAFERQGSCITARTVREAFPIPFVDDGPNGLGGLISPDDVEPAPAAPDDLVKRLQRYANVSNQVGDGTYCVARVCEEAAAEIARLTAPVTDEEVTLV